MEKINISIVILVYNSARTLRSCLDSIVNQKLINGEVEVNVVYRKSHDSSNQILMEYSNINVYHQKNTGIPQARNMGITNSKYDIIAFTDSDCVVDQVWLKCIEYNFRNNSKIDALSGPLIADRSDKSYVPYYYGIVGDAYGNVGKLATNNSAYRRQILNSVGGFDEKLPSGEDVDLSWKIEDAGYNIRFDKSFISTHKYRNTIKELFKEQKFYGTGRYLLISRYPKRFGILERHFDVLIYCTLLYFIYLCYSIFTFSTLSIQLIVLTISLIILFVIARRIRILKKIYHKEKLSTLIACIPIFFIIDFSNILGFLSKKK